MKIMFCKQAILLYKVYNSENQNKEWLSLFFNQNVNARNTKASFPDTSKFNVGRNILANRFMLLHNNWLNLPLNNYQM